MARLVAGANPLSTDATGGADFQGPVSAQGLTLNGGNPLAVPALNINGDGNMTKNPRIPWGVYLKQTSNATGVTFAQWPNSTPMVLKGMFGIALGASGGCSSPISFWIHNVTQNTDSNTVTFANGAGNTNNLTGQSFQIAAGETAQFRYTATRCTTSLFDAIITAEFEPQ